LKKHDQDLQDRLIFVLRVFDVLRVAVFLARKFGAKKKPRRGPRRRPTRILRKRSLRVRELR
jgi:hypothetical protein